MTPVKKQENTDKYRDIMNLPHPVSQRHRAMSMEQRAAQFLPFAALSGFGDAIERTARKAQAEAEAGITAESLEEIYEQQEGDGTDDSNEL